MLAKNYLKTAIIAVLWLPVTSIAGSAAGGATEVTQMLNNTELLAQTITQELQYATDLENLVLQTLQQLPGDDTSLLSDVRKGSELLRSAKGAKESLQQLRSDVGSLKTHAQRRYQNFVASGLTWSNYVGREKELARQSRTRAKVVTEVEEAAMDRVKATWDSYSRYQSEITESQGEHQSLRILNGQMNALIGTMNTMLDVSTTRSSVATEQEFQKTLREDESVERAKKAREARIRQHEYAIEQLNRMKGM